MIAAIVCLAVACAILFVVVLALALRRPAETDRERLLARDIDRLQRALDETTDKLLHVVGKDFNVPPVDLEPTDDSFSDEPDPFAHFRHHDELDGDTLLLEPRDAMSVSL